MRKLFIFLLLILTLNLSGQKLLPGFVNQTVTTAPSGGEEPAAIQVNLLAWYSGESEYVTLSGNEVTQWSDRSGNGYHLTSEATAYPTWSGGWLTHDGANDYLKNATATSNQPITIYMVYDEITYTGSDDIIRIQSTLQTRIEQSNDGEGIPAINAGTPVSAYPTGSTAPCIITGVFNGATSKIQVNDEVPVTGDAGARTMTEINVGAAGSYANFAVAEIIIKSGVDSAGDEDAILAYLAGKYSISLE